MLQALLDWLQNIDTSAFGELNDLDWTSIATYGAVTVAFAGIIWTASKKFLKFIWQKTEGFIGFAVSTLVVVSLWYTLLRVHVSISFNLDKEIFDNLLWFSAVLFTPYYLIHYKLLARFLLAVVRSVELVLDLLVFSWFPKKAEQNREKWRTRISNSYQGLRDGIDIFPTRKPAAEKKLEADADPVDESDAGDVGQQAAT